MNALELLHAQVADMKKKNQHVCDYQGYDFGAHYIDSQCIDGYLWNLDACDGSGNLYEPMETIPCPKCNSDAWLENYRWLKRGYYYGLRIATSSQGCNEKNRRLRRYNYYKGINH